MTRRVLSLLLVLVAGAGIAGALAEARLEPPTPAPAAQLLAQRAVRASCSGVSPAQQSQCQGAQSSGPAASTGGQSPSGAPAGSAGDPCSGLSLAQYLACKLHQTIQGAQNAPANIANQQAAQWLEDVAKAISDAAKWVLTQLFVPTLEDNSSVDLSGAWLRNLLGQIEGPALMAAVIMLLIACIQAATELSARTLVAALRNLAIGFASLPITIGLTQLVILLIDQWSVGLLDAQAGNLGTFAEKVVIDPQSTAYPVLLVIGDGGMVLIALFAIVVTMILRDAAIYLAILFAPLICAAIVWPALARGARRYAEFVASVVIGKFLIVLALCAGIALFAQPARPGAFTWQASGPTLAATDFAAGFICLLACLTPAGLFLFFPVIDRQGAAMLAGGGQVAMGWAENAKDLASGALSAATFGAMKVGGGGNGWSPSRTVPSPQAQAESSPSTDGAAPAQPRQQRDQPTGSLDAQPQSASPPASEAPSAAPASAGPGGSGAPAPTQPSAGASPSSTDTNPTPSDPPPPPPAPPGGHFQPQPAD